MSRLASVAAGIAFAALSTLVTPAQAGVSWSIGINAPIAPGVHVGTVIGGGRPVARYYAPVAVMAPPPVYVAPPPVYAPAPVVYAPRPVVYAPRPVAYRPPVVVKPVFVGGHWRHGHRPHHPHHPYQPQARGGHGGHGPIAHVRSDVRGGVR